MRVNEQAAARTLRIGGASGFWGDSEGGAAQLVHDGAIDYLVFDFLAEITMSLLARVKAKNPDGGYAPDFVRVIGDLAGDIQARGIKVISNAGGINPRACRAALEKELDARGIALRIAIVEGDDLLDRVESLRASGAREMFSGAPLPDKLQSINAYLGARPIVAALAAGADIVITGRCVDSAVTLAPLVHEFGWSWDDYDRLAMGSLAGHIIECGVQGTGGLFTDWEQVPGWDDMGFPIAECSADGTFVITKPADTGGLVTPATVSEQIVYEIGDPAAYLLPDVSCDFSDVTLSGDGVDRVRVSGARGRAPTTTYKVSATHADGWRLMGTIMIGGADAARKAERVGAAILTRAARMLDERGMSVLSETSLEVLGAESMYGPHARTAASREVILKIAARSATRDSLELLAREIAPSATAMAQGITGFAAGRPAPSPVVRLYSLLVDHALAPASVDIDGQRIDVDAPHGVSTGAPAPRPHRPALVRFGDEPTVTVPLLRIAHGRSGDKGDMANIGIIARSEQLYPLLLTILEAEAVAAYFAHLASGPVMRYDWPGLHAVNFTLQQALGGGGMASLRYDPQGKVYAQMLLDMPVTIPARFLDANP